MLRLQRPSAYPLQQAGPLHRVTVRADRRGLPLDRGDQVLPPNRAPQVRAGAEAILAIDKSSGFAIAAKKKGQPALLFLLESVNAKRREIASLPLQKSRALKPREVSECQRAFGCNETSFSSSCTRVASTKLAGLVPAASLPMCFSNCLTPSRSTLMVFCKCFWP